MQCVLVNVETHKLVKALGLCNCDAHLPMGHLYQPLFQGQEALHEGTERRDSGWVPRRAVKC